MPKTFVLIPGAWHGPWCYRRVADRLEAQGHKVFLAGLTGLAERHHLASDAVDLSTHVADVVNLVEWEDLRDICLVAHSYAGVVAGGAAEAIGDRVASIVFLDAFMPEAGRSMIDISPREVPESGNMTPYSAAGMRVNEADQAWVDAKTTPQPVHTYTEKLAAASAYLAIPRKTYVRTTFPSAYWQERYEAYAADPAWTTYLVESGHDVMIDAPDELARILVDVA
jgi:pimeloyl-ACP methyl ester carboxylesterase